MSDNIQSQLRHVYNNKDIQKKCNCDGEGSLGYCNMCQGTGFQSELSMNDCQACAGTGRCPLHDKWRLAETNND